MTARRCLVYLGSLALGAILASGVQAADKADPDADRLRAVLQTLDNDPTLAELAGLERLKARQSLTALQNARSRDREQLLYLAERWVEAAQAEAQAELLLQQSAQLDRERDQIMIEASRRDAELARREADRLRLQNLAQQEESERLAEQTQTERLVSEKSMAHAQATAVQARKLADARAKETALARKEAELAAAVAASSVTTNTQRTAEPPSVGTSFFTLSGEAFASGKATLTAGAQASLERLAGKLGDRGGIRIEGHTDNQGASAANLLLSQQRAEAVRQALIGQGVAASRIRAVGRGETAPVADNASEAGRARNRRVEIILQ